ncbi:hypothetical protein SO802_010435 [Lithocarpus litseifolius]|uniref:Uncharacterized protein n=1 Tax=Lithocarpus litseifolius TaxID=425828 RepID=A0AAW2DH78_9ROSI
MMNMDGVLAMINLNKLVIRGEFGQDLKEGYKENTSPTLKPVAPEASQHALKSPYELRAHNEDEERGAAPSDDEDESDDNNDSSSDSSSNDSGHDDDDSSTDSDDNSSRSYVSPYSGDD